MVNTENIVIAKNIVITEIVVAELYCTVGASTVPYLQYVVSGTISVSAPNYATLQSTFKLCATGAVFNIESTRTVLFCNFCCTVGAVQYSTMYHSASTEFPTIPQIATQIFLLLLFFSLSLDWLLPPRRDVRLVHVPLGAAVHRCPGRLHHAELAPAPPGFALALRRLRLDHHGLRSRRLEWGSTLRSEVVRIRSWVFVVHKFTIQGQ